MKKVLSPLSSEHALPIAVLCAITVLFFAPRFLGKSYSSVGQHMFASYPWAGAVSPDPGVPNRGYPQTDHAETYYPLSVFATQAWRSGEIPMWLPYSFGGIPIMELGMTSLLYPLRLLLIPFFDPPEQHDWMMFAHLLLAGLGMYALLRSWGANAPGAVVAAFVWQFNGHNMFWLIIEQMAIVAAWCPWMLWAATLAVQRRSFKWASLAGAILGIALFSGGTHYVHLSGWLLAMWYGTDVLRAVVIHWRQQQTRAALHYLLLPLVSLATALIVSLAYWLPLLNVLTDVSRRPFPLEAHLNQGSTWLALLQGMSLPRSAWAVAGDADFQSFSFTGLTAVVLAVSALLLNRSRHVRLAGGFLLVALLTVLGVEWWLKLLYHNLPFFNTMHLHPMFYVFTFALAVLAGFGWSELTRRAPRLRWLMALVILTGVVQMGLLLRAWNAVLDGHLAQGLGSLLDGRALLLLLVVSFCLGLAFWLRRRGGTANHAALYARSTFQYAPAVLIVFNLFLFAWLTLPHHWSSPLWYFPKTPLLTKLRSLPHEWRLLPLYQHAPSWTPPVLAGKTSAIFGLRSGQGYESLLPQRTALLWRTVEQAGTNAARGEVPAAYRPMFRHDELPLALLEKLSVGIFVTPPGVEPLEAQSGRNLVADGTLRPVYQGPDGFIYENPRALGRAFWVPQTAQVASGEEALNTLASSTFDARRAALIEAPLPPHEAAQLSASAETNPAPKQTTTHIVRESLNEIEIETAAAQAGILVLNDTWAAGWRVFVDGLPQTVHRVNYTSRGVVVSGGQHQVVFRYRPPLLLFSLGISLAALLLLAAWFLVTGIRRLRERVQSHLPTTGTSPGEP